jgi:hypothetical protein
MNIRTSKTRPIPYELTNRFIERASKVVVLLAMQILQNLPTVFQLLRRAVIFDLLAFAILLRHIRIWQILRWGRMNLPLGTTSRNLLYFGTSDDRNGC